jgi:cytochrome d ubiquinol oxidase subunit I
MSTELLARLQFAFTISFHCLYPPLSIGLGLLLVAIEALWLKAKIRSIPRWHT